MVCLKSCFTVLFLSMPLFAQRKGAKAAPVPEWRRDAQVFEKEIRAYYWAEKVKPDGEFPAVSLSTWVAVVKYP